MPDRLSFDDLEPASGQGVHRPDGERGGLDAPGEGSLPLKPAEPSGGDHQGPIAVVPFTHTHRELFSILDCTLVVYPDRSVLAYVPTASKPEMERGRRGIERAPETQRVEAQELWKVAGGPGMTRQSFDSIGVPERPWEAYGTYFRDAIVCVRKEAGGAAGMEQDMVRTMDEPHTLRIELGTSFSPRNALFSLV